MKQPYLLCGKIINTHGVRGVLKVDNFCDSPSAFAALPNVYIKAKDGTMQSYPVVTASAHGRFLLVSLKGIDTLELAVPLKGTELFAKREDIPLEEGGYFLADLIGLPVIDVHTDKVYGRIKSLDEAPASLLYVIETEKGDVLFPAVSAFVKRVDTECGVYVEAIEGFFS